MAVSAGAPREASDGRDGRMRAPRALTGDVAAFTASARGRRAAASARRAAAVRRTRATRAASAPHERHAQSSCGVVFPQLQHEATTRSRGCERVEPVTPAGRAKGRRSQATSRGGRGRRRVARRGVLAVPARRLVRVQDDSATRGRPEGELPRGEREGSRPSWASASTSPRRAPTRRRRRRRGGCLEARELPGRDDEHEAGEGERHREPLRAAHALADQEVREHIIQKGIV